MTKYRIIEANTKGYYHVQQWIPPKWWRKGYWYVHVFVGPGSELTFNSANWHLTCLLHEQQKAKEQAEYLKQSRAVIREEEVE